MKDTVIPVNKPKLRVIVAPRKLLDGSKVFDVWIGNVSLHAVTEEDAACLAEEFVELVANHTNNTADVVYE